MISLVRLLNWVSLKTPRQRPAWPEVRLPQKPASTSKTAPAYDAPSGTNKED